ncbi:MAG: hypothetical protein ACR2IF_07465 [Terriglobales bacterium]
MKATTIALLCAVAAAAVSAQTVPPSQKVAGDVKKAAAAQAAPAPKSPFKPMAKPRPAVAKKSAAKPSAGATTKAALKVPAKPAPGKRDPFVNPIREVGGASGPACSTGKKCLAVDSILLRGIVKSQQGMIAVVESSTRHLSYFLRENDPVFNGYVLRITGDTVVFRENVTDRVGKTATRDVALKVVAPVV